MFNIEKSTIILLVIIASGIITSIPFVESAIPPTAAYKTISVNGTELEAFTYNDILTLSSDGSISFDTVSVDSNSQDPNFPAWDYRKTITIDNTLVDSDLTGFPVLISFTDTDLRDKALSNGDDILFADVTGTQLDHEFEMYDGTTGQMIAWVKADLTDTLDTVIYMYYGNSASSNQENIEAVWDDNYGGVWHLHDDFLDSTSTNADGTNTGTVDIVGQIGNAQDFDGIADNIKLGTNLYNSQTQGSISAWIEPTNPTDDAIFMMGDNGAASSKMWWIRSMTYSPDGANQDLQVFSRSTSGNHRVYGDTSFVDGQRHYVTITGDGVEHRVFKDGVEQSIIVCGACSNTGNWFQPNVGGSNQDYWIGAQIRNGISIGGQFEGIIDEVRSATTVLSPEWISTEYNNQIDPSLFYSVGSEELFGVTDEIIFSVVGGSGGSVLDATTPRMIKHSVQPIDSQSFEITGLPIFDFLNIQGLITLNGSTSTKIEMEFNNDTGSNYSRGSVGNSNDIQVSFASSSKDRKFYQEWHNMNSKTGYQRVIVFDNGTADFHSGLAFEAVSYNGTDRIESIKLRSQSGVSVIESGSWVNVIGWNSTE